MNDKMCIHRYAIVASLTILMNDPPRITILNAFSYETNIFNNNNATEMNTRIRIGLGERLNIAFITTKARTTVRSNIPNVRNGEFTVPK